MLGCIAVLLSMLILSGPGDIDPNSMVVDVELPAALAGSADSASQGQADRTHADLVTPAFALSAESRDPDHTAALPDLSQGADLPAAHATNPAMSVPDEADPVLSERGSSFTDPAPKVTLKPPSDEPTPGAELPERDSDPDSPGQVESAETLEPATRTSGLVAKVANVEQPPGDKPNAESSQQPELPPAKKRVASKDEPASPQVRRAAILKETVTPQARRKPKSESPTLSAGTRSRKSPSGAQVGASANAYAARVRAAIGRHKPKAVGHGGSATVSFAISASGALRYVRVSHSSGKAQLDQMALATLSNAAPFPPPPSGLNVRALSYTIQIYFR
jgi:periplasmic protein TonB